MKIIKKVALAAALISSAAVSFAGNGIHFTNNTNETFTPHCSVDGREIPPIIHLGPHSSNIELDWSMLQYILHVPENHAMKCDFSDGKSYVYHADMTVVSYGAGTAKITHSGASGYSVTLSPDDGGAHTHFEATISNA